MIYPDEQWAKVGECPTYTVSNYGRLKSRYLDYTTGELGELLLKPCYSWQGRVIVTMRSGPKKRRQYLVHRLVMAAFGPPQPSPSHIVAHNDGDCLNNHISNLRWATFQENADDRIKHGKSGKGADNPRAKITDEAVREIRDTPYEWGLCRRMAEKYGLGLDAISRIRQRKTWTHIA